MRPVLISPSFQKDYRNPHIVAIWHQADAMLRKAKRVIFIGYSLPEDDIHVVYILKRAAGHLRDDAVTVVEYDPAEMRAVDLHPVGRRYMWLFGADIDWHPEGFSPWLETASSLGQSGGRSCSTSSGRANVRGKLASRRRAHGSWSRTALCRKAWQESRVQRIGVCLEPSCSAVPRPL